MQVYIYYVQCQKDKIDSILLIQVDGSDKKKKNNKKKKNDFLKHLLQNVCVGVCTLCIMSVLLLKYYISTPLFFFFLTKSGVEI